MKSLTSFVILSAIFVGACAIPSQTVRLDPRLPLPAQTQNRESARLTVLLEVKDVRDHKVIGLRGNPSDAKATITADPDFVDAVRRTISETLEARGFAITTANSKGARTLTVEITDLNYTHTTVEQKSMVQIQATLRVVAFHGLAKWEKSYTAEREQQVAIIPVAKTNEEWINETLSDALERLCKDDALFTHLL